MATATTRKKTTVRFNPADLPETGTVQFRQGGDYKPSISALLKFAKGDPTNVAHVKALIHLGWVKPGGVNATSESGACDVASRADLPAACWTAGEPAGPQISANLQALAEAGAPAEALDALWGCYVGGGVADVL
jgi:hypothetical protein